MKKLHWTDSEFDRKYFLSANINISRGEEPLTAATDNWKLHEQRIDVSTQCLKSVLKRDDEQQLYQYMVRWAEGRARPSTVCMRTSIRINYW